MLQYEQGFIVRDPVKYKIWVSNNKERIAGYQQKYDEKHPDARRKASTKYREKNRETIRASKLVKREATAGRPISQVCELCSEGARWMVLDHCHTYGHFRGWLCDRCNKTLGLVKDNPELLRSMADYLERTQGGQHGQTEGKNKELAT